MDRLPSPAVCAQRTRAWWSGQGLAGAACPGPRTRAVRPRCIRQALLQIYEQSQAMTFSTAIAVPYADASGDRQVRARRLRRSRSLRRRRRSHLQQAAVATGCRGASGRAGRSCPAARADRCRRDRCCASGSSAFPSSAGSARCGSSPAPCSRRDARCGMLEQRRRRLLFGQRALQHDAGQHLLVAQLVHHHDRACCTSAPAGSPRPRPPRCSRPSGG